MSLMYKLYVIWIGILKFAYINGACLVTVITIMAIITAITGDKAIFTKIFHK
ncbi:hypothetical protein [Clostridium celatum]|uniref:hypothetical protein n=1 Tax=Clostridium celatum TaxID=36834 RepID=UPI00290BE8F3|nr:hypothetical protein [Clostridium celatum]MDU6295582.1 hypothetical protein [Clostridium celatum]